MANYKFLLISHPINNEWIRVLTRVLLPYGSLTVIQRNEVSAIVPGGDYQIIFVDTGIKEADEDSSMLLHLINRLHALCARSEIIITTPSTNWRQAKEFIQAGAADYLRQSMNEKKQLDEIEQSMPFLKLSKS
jgi:DNA-binding NtrC family response regulator